MVNDMAPPQPNSKLRNRITAAAIICLFLVLAFGQPTIFSQSKQTGQTKGEIESQSPLVVRVGAIYYDDSAEQYQKIQAILSAMERAEANNKSKRSITFKVVVGTYDEVFHWYRSDQIDLAVMNPGPLALLLKEFGHDALSKSFVGIRGVMPAPNSIASAETQTPRAEYNSIILVNREAIRSEFPSLHTKATLSEAEGQQLIDFILDKARRRQAHFLFVHPFSTSGYIFPRKFLKERTGVDLDLSDYELTYSHNVSLQEVRDSEYDESNRLNVAFVSDETQDTLDDKKVLAIRAGELNTKIVQDALLFTPDFVQREAAELQRIKDLLNKGPQTFSLSTPADWSKKYEEVGKWIETFNGDKPLMLNELTIDQIIRRINNYTLHHPEKPARVALVLSGGGAKCAYQLGAVEVIEDKLTSAQQRSKEQRPGIDLVVGTSGGAINALTIAAEVTRNVTGRENLRTTWENFGQAEILKPSNLVRRALGLAIGLPFALLLINWFYYLHLKRLAGDSIKRERKQKRHKSAGTIVSLIPRFLNRFGRRAWSEQAGIVLLLLSLTLYLVGQKPVTLTDHLTAQTLLRQHVLIHVAEYGGQTLRWTAVPFFVLGLILIFDRFLASRQRGYATFSENVRLWAIIFVVLLALALPVATLFATFKLQDSLFVSSGIEEKMAVEMPKLLGCNASAGCSSHHLAEISREIINQGLIKRDLVITGSVFSASSATKQSDSARRAHDETDLYFVYKTGTSDLPEALRKDNRFVSLKDAANTSILLDAVIGSGSIFPAFEPRHLGSVKRVMDKDVIEDVSIIDGGFVHNSPTEAAVKLEATHIIVLEASPEDSPSQDVNLLNNSVAAFNHLFTQAQLLDARSRRQAEIFTLRPARDPFLCTLDFGKNYITEAMKWGAEDALDTKKPRFVRQPRPSGL